MKIIKLGVVNAEKKQQVDLKNRNAMEYYILLSRSTKKYSYTELETVLILEKTDILFLEEIEIRLKKKQELVNTCRKISDCLVSMLE